MEIELIFEKSFQNSNEKHAFERLPKFAQLTQHPFLAFG
jgi:hypothetical protein